MKRITKTTLTSFLLFFVVLLFPRFARIEAYQNALWTSNNRCKDAVTSDLQIDNQTSMEGLITWNRIWIGLPFKAITVDSIARPKLVVQLRFEMVPILINGLFGVALSGLAFALGMVAKSLKK